MALKKDQLDAFFLKIDKGLSVPASIFLTGGVASWLMGGTRPTEDIDFALKSTALEETDAHIQKVSNECRIKVEYSEDISRWGMVGYPNFWEKAQLYKKFGQLSVYVLEPTIWSVGKLERSLETDISDIVVVFKSQKVRAHQAIRTWTIAIQKSPLSTEKGFFIKKVNYFLKTSGKKVWGKGFNAEEAFSAFQKAIQKR